MSNDMMPPVGHTDDYGSWHWGSYADRMARIHWEESRRRQNGEAERALRKFIQNDIDARQEYFLSR